MEYSGCRPATVRGCFPRSQLKRSRVWGGLRHPSLVPSAMVQRDAPEDGVKVALEEAEAVREETG